MPINKNSITSNGLPGNDIPPAVAHHEALFKGYSPLPGRRPKHAGFGFAAPAIVGLAMRAHPDFIDRQQRPQSIVHRGNHLGIDQTVSDIRLIRDDYDDEARPLEFRDRGFDAGQQPEAVQAAQRVRLPVAHLATGNDSITIKENGALQAA